MSLKYESTIVEFGNTSSAQECITTCSSLNSTWTDLVEKLEELSAEKIEKENEYVQ